MRKNVVILCSSAKVLLPEIILWDFFEDKKNHKRTVLITLITVIR